MPRLRLLRLQFVTSTALHLVVLPALFLELGQPTPPPAPDTPTTDPA